MFRRTGAAIATGEIMKFSVAFLLLASVGGTALAQSAPSASDLVAKNLEARGGAQALAAINTLDFKGKYVAPGDFQLTFHEVRQRNAGHDRVRDDLDIQGLTIVQAYDGQSAWKINPFQGRKDAERMSADEARAQADAALVDGVLLASRGDGSAVRYLGREDFDGTLGYKVQVRQRDGDQYDFLLDPDTFLEIRATETRQIRGAPTINEYEYGDYEKVGGVYYPMAIDSWQPNAPDQRSRILIATGTANGAVAESLFSEPGGSAPPAAKAAPDASEKPPSAPDGDAPPPTPPKTR
jgi:hypothetical protein